MARMRTIKPEACSSETLAAIDRAVRWTFACLWTHCDDEGRSASNPRLIKAALYPLDDAVTPDVVARELAELEAAGALCMYEVDGKEYLHIPSWAEHQHPNRKVTSKLPPCPKADHSPTGHTQRSESAVSAHGAVTPVVVVVDGVVDGDEGGAAATPTAQKRGRRIPEDWTPSAETKRWTLTELDQPTAARELEKFRNYWRAKSGKDATKLDWDLTWRNWVMNAHSGRASPNGSSTADQRVNEGLALAARLREPQLRELPA